MPPLLDKNIPTRMFRAGRQRGTKNIISHSVKQNVLQVFAGLGGWEAMLQWAEENKTIFYGSVYPKLLPVEMAESGLTGNITVIVQQHPEQPKQIPLETTPSDTPTNRYDELT